MVAVIPPLPSGWPYTVRTLRALEASVPVASIPGLGDGWTLHLAERVALDSGASELSHAFGRGGIQRIGEVVIRPYRRGGLVRHLNGRIYGSPERFEREFAVHRALWGAGFPTVEPIGYGFRRRGWGVEGVYLTRFAEARAWPTRWERSAEVVPQLAVQLRFLAAWGLHAPDLNATNVLLTGDGRVLTLDWDRARWSADGDLLARYQARMERSLRKLGAPEPVLAQFSKSLAG